jgi:micrococcal nuclease
MRKWPLVIVLILALIGMILLSLLPESTVKEERIVTKIIDGDTVVVSGGDTIRLLGMDTDEKGYPCYNVAKKRLEALVLDKQVILEQTDENKDMYGRYLRYIFVDGVNVNIQMIQEGLAVARLSTSNVGKYDDEIRQAEAYAIENKIGCKWNSTG